MSFFGPSFRLIRSFFLVSFVRSFAFCVWTVKGCYGAVIFVVSPAFLLRVPRERETHSIVMRTSSRNAFAAASVLRLACYSPFLRDSYFLLCFHFSVSDSSRYCAFPLVPGETGRGGGSTCPCLSIIPFRTRT